MTDQNPKVVVQEDTKAELDAIGSKNETYDDIIKRLIKFWKVGKNAAKRRN